MVLSSTVKSHPQEGGFHVSYRLGILHIVSSTRLPKHEGHKDDTNGDAKIDREGAQSLKPCTNNYRQRRHARSGRNSIL